MLNATLWKLYRSRWRTPAVERTPGYTLLLMVPGDLPVFLRIAMETCAAQKPENLVETLVIPDMPTPAFERIFEAAAKTWPSGPIRLVNLHPIERFVTRHTNSPHTNHWLQLTNGLEACRSTHALMHDADLFITRKDFLAAHYTAAAAGDFACFGINRVWDDWYAANDLGHVTATWELMVNVDWAKTFKPWQLRGHDGAVDGKTHTFDTLLLPQCQTPPAKIGRHGGDAGSDWGFVHFNYVICTYRWFKESKEVYADEHFRILLIRLLVDAFASSETEEQVPSLAELEKAIDGKSSRVTYAGTDTGKNYPEFRGKLQQLIDSGNLDARKVEVLREGVRPFDAAFSYTPPSAASSPVHYSLDDKTPRLRSAVSQVTP